MALSIVSDGRRHYVVGDTYPLKSQLKNAGFHWDADRRGWWIGDKTAAEKIVGEAGGAGAGPDARPSESLTPDSEILGKAKYKEKIYLLVWEGSTKRGWAAKLAFRDGSKVFWADSALVNVFKRYDRPITLRRLNELRAEYAARGETATPAPEAHTHARRGRARCECSDPGCECQRGRCRCEPHCNCRGGNVYDC